MSFYGGLAKTVGNLLAKYGNATAQLVRSVPGAYDPVTGTATVVETAFTVSVLLDASGVQTLGFKFGVGSINAGDLEATVAAEGLPVTPIPGDVLKVGGDALQVVKVQTTPSIKNPVIHSLLVRR